jgi:hypothetical protein
LSQTGQAGGRANHRNVVASYHKKSLNFNKTQRNSTDFDVL